MSAISSAVFLQGGLPVHPPATPPRPAPLHSAPRLAPPRADSPPGRAQHHSARGPRPRTYGRHPHRCHHGGTRPLPPIFTDGYLDEALTLDLARSIVARPGWTVLLFPTIPIGSVSAEVIGHRWTFPGSFSVRQSTVRDLFMDLGDSFGRQGFRHILIVDSHGGPGNSRALDQASDYFHSTYGGRMTHLLGLMPVVDAVKALEQTLTPAQLAENGVEVHAGALEQSTGLFLRPGLSPAGYRTAPSLPGTDFAGLIAQASKPAWPGYLGAPRLATPAIGALAYRQTIDILRNLTPDILDGKLDPTTLPRYGDVFTALAAEVEQPRLQHEAQLAEQHAKWLAAHPDVLKGPASTVP